MEKVKKWEKLNAFQKGATLISRIHVVVYTTFEQKQQMTIVKKWRKLDILQKADIISRNHHGICKIPLTVKAITLSKHANISFSLPPPPPPPHPLLSLCLSLTHTHMHASTKSRPLITLVSSWLSEADCGWATFTDYQYVVAWLWTTKIKNMHIWLHDSLVCKC